MVQALARSNSITPAGNIREGDETLIISQNAVVENIRELENIPLKLGAGPSVYVRDIANVELGSDVTTGYALINGKRSVYIPVTKRADAATWDVVQRVKAALPDMQAAVPEDIKVTYAFDQSGYVINSLKSLMAEGILGAILTGLMVLLFLRDIRGAFIVVITIPLALLSAVIFLKIFGQTLNVMTLGGLALAIGILVDESTVTIENIHHHQELGKSKAKAIWDACREIALPKLLILLCVIAVFVPALFMTGIPGSMFLPLSLAVGFAMVASFLLSQTLVPVLSHWLLKDRMPEGEAGAARRFNHFRVRYKHWLKGFVEKSSWATPVYLLLAFGLLAGGFMLMGTEIFPKTDAGQAQVRLRLPAGTRVERTETATQEVLHWADSIANGHIEISSAFVGVQPSSYPVNLIHLWTSGPHESVIKIKLRKGTGIPIEEFKEALRKAAKTAMPTATLSFEPGDMVEQVVNLGSSNPIEIAVMGRNLSQSRKVAADLNKKLQEIAYLRDVQIATPLEYPGIKLNIDRVKAGQLGLTVDQISKSTVTATSSSRFTQPNYWLDKNTGTAYQVQVEYPQYRINNSEELGLVPVTAGTGNAIYLRDVATPQKSLHQANMIALTSSGTSPLQRIFIKDVGTAIKDVKNAIASLGQLPAGVKIMLRGQADLLDQTMSELETGLLIAIVVIFLMLTVNFQSFRLSLTVLSVVPAVIAGAVLMLLATGQTLNIQSYMGTIMAVGVAVANAILLVTNGEQYRKLELSSGFAVTGASNRLRPILMTSLAMIAGMVPMAIGLGEGGDQTAPLGIAVIGGLIFSTISTLVFLPAIYTRMMGRKAYHSPSLYPEDRDSRYYDANNE